MAIKYVVSKSANPQDRENQFYAGRIKQTDHLSMLSIAKVISDQCSVTSSDVVGTYHNLLYAMRTYLMQGNILRLDQFGTLRMVIKGETAPSPDAWKPGMIRGARILFTPGAMLRSALRSAEFRSAGKGNALLEEEAELEEDNEPDQE